MEKDFKICTITHHTVPNYGAVLQAYALQKLLDKYKVNNEILNYKSERVERTYYRSFFKCENLKKKIIYLLYYRSRKRYKKFDGFVINELRLSQMYNKNDLNKTNGAYDLFITGSDQVWNLNIHRGDTTYMLDFVNDNKKKGSYAASFGYKDIPKQFEEQSKNLINQFEYILLREDTGLEIISKLGITKNCDVVVDPTLLLDKDDYIKLIGNENSGEKYILCYDLINSPKLIDFALNLSKKFNLKIKNINTSLRSVKGMENLFYEGPIEFLKLFYNAEYIVTSSFHGMIFSLIFNKCFFYKLNDSKVNNNSRIIDLSNRLGVDAQDIDNEEINYRMDYVEINKKLDVLKKESINKLLKMVNSAKSSSDER